MKSIQSIIKKPGKLTAWMIAGGMLLMLGLALLLLMKQSQTPVRLTPGSAQPETSPPGEEPPPNRLDAYRTMLNSKPEQSIRQEDPVRTNWRGIYDQVKQADTAALPVTTVPRIDPQRRGTSKKNKPAPLASKSKYRAPRPARKSGPRRITAPSSPAPVAVPEQKPAFNIQSEKTRQASTSHNQSGPLGTQSRRGVAEPKHFVRAVIARELKAWPGHSVPLQLLDPIKTPRLELPAKTLVYARLGGSGARVQMIVEQVEYKGGIYPVQWACHDPYWVAGIPLDKRGKSAQDATRERLEDRSQDVIRRRSGRIPIVSDAVKGVSDALKGLRRNNRGQVELPANYLVYLHIPNH